MNGISMPCHGVTTNGSRCKRVCLGKDYCFIHENQRAKKHPVENVAPIIDVVVPPKHSVSMLDNRPAHIIRILSPMTEVKCINGSNCIHQMTIMKVIDEKIKLDLSVKELKHQLNDIAELTDQLKDVRSKYASIKSLYNKALTNIRGLNGEISVLKDKIETIESLSDCRAFSIDEHLRESELIRFVEYINQFDAEDICERLGMSYDDFWAKFNPLRMRRNKICHPMTGEYTDDELLKMLG